MNQKNPLLNYKVKCDVKEGVSTEKMSYDLKEGLWKNEFGVPIIKKFIEDCKLDASGETLITKTREGIDRSEGSSANDEYQQNDNKKILSLVGETVITETREGVDRSENSSAVNVYNNNNNNYDSLNFLGETMITRTREGIDSSESSNYAMGTLITYTRESIDRSEQS